MSTWGIRRIVDILHGLAQFYYRKYGAMARRMGRPGILPDERQGFIVVQIDGLAYEHLLEAMQAGYLPYLSHMVDERHLTLAPWHCTLPTTTPAAQAAIMFGTQEDIPGFRWYEKERDLAIVAKRPDQVQALQTRLKENRPGILAGGSSYVNMFDGDADLALFTLSALNRQRLFESVRGMGLLLLFLLSPLRILQVVGRTTLGYLRTIGWRLAALARHSSFKPYDLLAPLTTAAVNALFTEVQTFGVILDIYRCVPSIYTNYNTYDEAAHHLGANHPAAFTVLRDIDHRIRQIDRMRNRYQGREYDLYVLSDHGNTPSVPFSCKTGQSLGRLIAAQLGEETSLDEMSGQRGHALAKAHYLLDEVHGLEDQVPQAVRRTLCALRNYVDRHIPADPEVENYNLERRRDVVVRASGPLAHVYFNITPHRMDLVEVGLLYPRLLDRLSNTEAIGLVIGRAGQRTMALGPKGGSAVIDNHRVTIEPPNPLTPYGDIRWVARQIHRLATFPHSGDLILMGSLGPDGRVIAFEEQVATHGGLGGGQEWPFIAWPTEVNPGIMQEPQDLYWFFREQYLGGLREPIL